MTLSLWIDNLLAYSLQMAILTAAGTLLIYLFRLRVPRISLIYWQGLLLACLLLPVLQKWEHPTIVRTAAIVEPTEISVSIPAVAADPAPVKIPATQIIVLTLAAGAVLRMLWLGLGLVRLHFYLRRSEPIADTLPDTGSVSYRMGVKARFFISDQIKSPATFGIFTPTVLLPRSFHGMSKECREAVVCHELLHVRRRDWASVLFEELVRTLFWFHPAVWWLLSRIHLAREQAVDMEAVRLMGDRKPYLNSLLEIARTHGRPKGFPAPLFLRERHLVQRVALLVKEVSMNRLRLIVSLAGITFLLSGTVLMASGWFPLTGPAIVIQEEIVTEEAESEPLNTSDVPEDPVPTQTEQTSPARQRLSIVKSNGDQSDDKLVLQISDMELRSFIQHISEFLNLTPLIVDSDVQGFVTVHSSEPMSKSTVLTLFHQILRNNNASLIEEDGIYQVVPISTGLKTSGVAGGVTSSGSGIVGGVVEELVAGLAGKTQPPPKRMGNKVLESKLIHQVKPEYPEPAKRARIQDNIILNVTVDEKGNVAKAEPVRGHQLLQQAAVDAVKQWKYEPTIINGTPIPVIATVTVNFILPEATKSDTPIRTPMPIDNNALRSRLIHQVPPEYPELAKRARVQDAITLAVTVDEKGNVVKAEPIRGNILLRDAAALAVRQWRYKPTLINDTPTPVIAAVIVDFILDQDSSSPVDAEPGSPDSISYSYVELMDPNTNLANVLVVFDNEGEIYVNDIKTTPDNFESILRKETGGKKSVFIVAKPNTPYRRITDLIDRIDSLDIELIGHTVGKPE